VHPALRIEWAWSLARKTRWEEEIDHVQEEMRRFLASSKSRVETWISRASMRPDVTSVLSTSLRAYAYRQSYIITSLAVRASILWDYSDDSITSIPPFIMQLVRDPDSGATPGVPEVQENANETGDEDDIDSNENHLSDLE
jgi:hypothetical protein